MINMNLTKIKTKLNNAAQYLYWYRRLRPGKNTVYMVCVPNHENVGDAAIVLGVENILRHCNYEHIVDISTAEFWEYRQCLRRLMPKNALIVLNGGGSMGDVYALEEHNRRCVLETFSKHRIVIFPQTIYYKEEKNALDSVCHYNHKNITIAAREQTSLGIMMNLYPQANVILASDAVLSMNYSPVKKDRNGIVVCFRGDKEQKLSNQDRADLMSQLADRGFRLTVTEMMHGAEIPKEIRKHVVEDKIILFTDAKLVITDRLHAMILCAISGTPCLVFGNNHHKVSGVYEWIKHLNYIQFVHTVEEALQKTVKYASMGSCTYTPRMSDFQSLMDAVRPE